MCFAAYSYRMLQFFSDNSMQAARVKARLLSMINSLSGNRAHLKMIRRKSNLRRTCVVDKNKINSYAINLKLQSLF